MRLTSEYTASCLFPSSLETNSRTRLALSGPLFPPPGRWIIDGLVVNTRNVFDEVDSSVVPPAPAELDRSIALSRFWTSFLIGAFYTAKADNEKSAEEEREDVSSCSPKPTKHGSEVEGWRRRELD